jgi:hypothetical protein
LFSSQTKNNHAVRLPTALDAAIAELPRDRSAVSAAQANRDVYRPLKDRVRDDDGRSIYSPAA